MNSLTVNISSTSIPVRIGRGASHLVSSIVTELHPSALVLLSDETVYRLYGSLIESVLPERPIAVVVAPGESSKSLETASRVYDKLADHRIGRDALLLALGGGVIGDLGGFVAATWHRGIRYLQIPTTTEAAMDASVGGKTAINHRAGKNLVGAFHQPSAILIDTDFFRTLPDRDYFAGIAESVKHGATLDSTFVEWQEHFTSQLAARDEAIQPELIQRNCAIKAAVVATDEKETGRRMILNHGHTIGHALETALAFELRHGECVSLGMLAENELAVQRGLLNADDAARIHTLLSSLHLPVRLPRPIDPRQVLEGVRQDKKNRSGRTRFVLLNGIGATVIVDDVRQEELANALEVIAPDGSV